MPLKALLDALLLARAVRGSELGGGATPLPAALAAFEIEMMRRAAPKVRYYTCTNTWNEVR